MPWQVIQYMDDNPQMDAKDVIAHYAGELEVDAQIDCIKNEVESVLLLREQLRPLYGKKMEASSQMAVLNSEFDMDVMQKYPKKQGSPADRKNYKTELQNNSSQYQHHLKIVDEVKDTIEQLEEELYAVQEKAKNARRLLEAFNHYVSFILACTTPGAIVPVNRPEGHQNDNAF